MKKDIHPKYYENCKVSCACGNSFVIGSTQKEISVEICSKCHPFYTGKQKLIDTARRVEKFEEKIAKQKKVAATRKGKKAKRETLKKKKDEQEVKVKTQKKTVAKQKKDKK